MVLTGNQIKEEVEKGNILITDFDPKRLNNCSYNVKVGLNYYSQITPTRVPGYQSMYVVDPFNKADCSRMWKLHQNVVEILIPPNKTVLCHTEEFIGSVRGSVPQLRSRSSMMRNLLTVAPGAGWGDVGFVGRWAFTITNHSGFDVIIKPGSQVAQMIFEEISGEVEDYDGQYNTNPEDWSPTSMIPQGVITNK